MTTPPSILALVLDDDLFVLKLVDRMLVNQGITPVTTYDNGHAALKWLDSADGHPDLILLDLNMPEMDGIEFIRHLAERGYRGSIILISSESERTLLAAEKLIRARQLTLLGSLPKPATPEGLAALLAKWPPMKKNRLPEAKHDYSADEVHAAIANGELVNYYQPKVAVDTGELVGIEVLVRWQHPVDGLVQPGQFLATMDEHGLMGDLSSAVLANALAQAGVWHKMGLKLRVSVNITMHDLASLDFADFVARLAASAGVPPQQVSLEVPESHFAISNMHIQLENLARLRLKSFRLSADNFGRAGVSLTHLSESPFDEIKIDFDLIRSQNDAQAKAKYQACLSVAKELGMTVAAKGVENRDDWNFLRRAGCDIVQGYFISRPMPAALLPAWVKEWEART